MTNEWPTGAVPVPRDPSTQVARLSYPQSDVTVCTVRGDVDMVTRPALARTLTEAIRDANPHLVIDLSGVAFFGSTGLHTLVELLDRQHAAGHLALVVEQRAQVDTLLRATGLDTLFDVHGELASALRACHHPMPA